MSGISGLELKDVGSRLKVEGLWMQPKGFSFHVAGCRLKVAV